MAWFSIALESGPRLPLVDFERLPEEEPYRRELVRGRLVCEPPAGSLHGWIGATLTYRLRRHVGESGAGAVFGAETGFVLHEEPPTVRAPDAAFVALERIPAAGLPQGYFRGAPDLAVEIVASVNTPTEIADKVRDYLGAGTRVVWVVEPRSRTLTVHRPGLAPRTCAAEDIVDGGDVLPGLALRVGELFGG